MASEEITKSETLEEKIEPSPPERFPKNLASAKQEYTALHDRISHLYKIEGKTIDEWNAHFKVEFPEHMDFAVTYRLLSKVAGLYMEALGYHEKATLLSDILNRELKSEKAKLFTQIKRSKDHRNGTRPPSDDYVNNVIEELIDDVYNRVTVSEYMVKFWDGKIKSLVSIRRALESILYGLGAEAKANLYPDSE